MAGENKLCSTLRNEVKYFRFVLKPGFYNKGTPAYPWHNKAAFTNLISRPRRPEPRLGLGHRVVLTVWRKLYLAKRAGLP